MINLSLNHGKNMPSQRSLRLEGAQATGRAEKNLRHLSHAESQSSQRKTSYICVQNYEKAQFCPHFMPLRGRSIMLYRLVRGWNVSRMAFSPILMTKKLLPLRSLRLEGA